MKEIFASASDQIMHRVRASGPGSVFTPSDFLQIAAHPSVNRALARLVKRGQLRRLARGLYDFPKVHPKIGPLSPTPDCVAQALARKTGSQVQSDGARAAHVLGLSTQVPSKSTYLTDGPSRRVVLGNRVIHLRHASPRHLIAPGSPAGTVVQALRHVGLARSSDVVQIATHWLSANDKKTLASAAGEAPAWMRKILHVITSDDVGSTLHPRKIPAKRRFSEKNEQF